MSRRSSIFEDVLKAPWYVSAALAVVFYGIALISPAILSGKPTLVGAAVALKTAFNVLGLLFTLASVVALVIPRISKQSFKQTKSLQQIRSLTWQQFETYIAEAYREQGYQVTKTPEGADGGVDLILRKDNEVTFVQCKHWKANKVGVAKVREFFGAMASGGADAGIFVTAGEFTKEAEAFATQHGIKAIDGPLLEDLIKTQS